MSTINSSDLKQIIAKIEALNSEKNEIAQNIREAFLEAKTKGYDVPTIRKVIKLRSKSSDDIEYEDELLDTYRAALGI